MVLLVHANLLLLAFGWLWVLRPDAISGDLAAVRSDRPGMRVLFVGNSYTTVNSMPVMLSKLADGDTGAPAIFTVQYGFGGSTLARAVEDDRLTGLLTGDGWHHVVLQEQSQIPARPELREELMVPAATRLHSMVKARGAQTILFMTWGHRGGDGADVRHDTYEAMQGRLSDAYLRLGATLATPVAPVGFAWQEALRRRPDLDLWWHDGRHPSREGSYLTACVFYALLVQRDPARSKFMAGLPPRTASVLQRSARRSVNRLYPGLVAAYAKS